MEKIVIWFEKIITIIKYGITFYRENKQIINNVKISFKETMAMLKDVFNGK